MTGLEITLVIAGALIVFGCALVARCDAEWMGTAEKLSADDFEVHP